MKQVNLTISFDEEKLSALKRYMSKRDLELEREMTDALVNRSGTPVGQVFSRLPLHPAEP